MRSALLLALSAAAATAWPQRQYEGLPFPPHEIFDALSAFAESNDFPAIEKAARRLEPLFEALDPKGRKGLARGIRDSAVARDAASLRRGLLSLILEDLRFNLNAARAAPAKAPELLQMAFMDYSFLAPAVRARDKSLDAAIRREFKAAFRTRDLSGIEKTAASLEGRW